MDSRISRDSPSAADYLAGDLTLRAALDRMQLGVTISDRRGRIVYVNPALAAMHLYAPEELLGQPTFVLGAQTARQTLTPESLSSRKRWRRETLNVRKDGTTFPVELRSDVLEDETGQTLGIVTVCEDISERKRHEEDEARSALRDPLTRLPSRGFFLQLLERVIRRRERHAEYQFVVLYIDLDRFTLINDSLGHAAGDAVLVAVAERLLACIRPSDVLARLAGDEFAALLDDVTDPADGTRVAERFRAALESPLRIGDRELFLTTSVGIALSGAGHAHAEEYLTDASAAMQRARTRGEGQYEVFDPAVHRRATGMLRLETDLRRALARQEFHVMYQPIVDLRAERISGFEALVRWRHGERGLIAPGEFIPIAEQSGLIVPIGSYVLETACRQVAEWRRRFPRLDHLYVNVNLSARHLHQAGVVGEVLETLARHEVPPHSINVELTESMLMEDARAQLQVLPALQVAGVGVAIDDFGTGYSSLSYLRRFRVDTLKIDRSFLGGTDDADAWAIVRMIVALATGMRVSVVAEGVETEEQKRMLVALGCDKAQGYLFDKPLDPEVATERLAARLTGNTV